MSVIALANTPNRLPRQSGEDGEALDLDQRLGVPEPRDADARHGGVLPAAEIGQVWKRLVGRDYPAMAGIGIARLWDAEALVEVQGFAVLP